jgi:hypothetical protein
MATQKAKDSPTSNTTLTRVKITTHKQMKVHCAKHGLNMAAFVDAALRRALGFDGGGNGSGAGNNGSIRPFKRTNGTGKGNGTPRTTTAGQAIQQAQEILSQAGLKLVLVGTPEVDEGRIKIGSIMLENPAHFSNVATELLPPQLVA